MTSISSCFVKMKKKRINIGKIIVTSENMFTFRGVFVQLIGVAVVILGSLLLADERLRGLQSLRHFGPLQSAAVLVIVIGVLVIILGFIGCLAINTRSRLLLLIVRLCIYHYVCTYAPSDCFPNINMVWEYTCNITHKKDSKTSKPIWKAIFNNDLVLTLVKRLLFCLRY